MSGRSRVAARTHPVHRLLILLVALPLFAQTVPSPALPVCPPVIPASMFPVDFSGSDGCSPAQQPCTAGKPLLFFSHTAGVNEICIGAFTWDFGDGTTQAGREVTHGYAEAGEYLVTLQISGLIQPRTALVVVAPRFHITATPRAAPNTFVFTPALDRPVTEATEWAWSFGDGTAPVRMTGPALTPVVHSYAKAGKYAVTLAGAGAVSRTEVAVTAVPRARPAR